MSKTSPPGPLARLARGDREALEDCVSAYGGLVWTLARRFCSTRADAEDAAQDVFLELWQCAGRFDPGAGSERTFVAVVARRRLIDRVRRARARPRTESLAESEPPASPSTTANAFDSALLAQVSSGIGRLRPDHRRVLEMSLVDGYSHSEIAGALELPLGTVKTIVRRSLHRLREELALSA